MNVFTLINDVAHCSTLLRKYKCATQQKLHSIPFARPKNIYTKNQINAIAAASIRMSVAKPRMLDKCLLVYLPMIVLLLQMCKIMAIITGAVMPYKTADHNNAITGLMPRNWMDKPMMSEMITVM